MVGSISALYAAGRQGGGLRAPVLPFAIPLLHKLGDLKGHGENDQLSS